MRTRIGEFRKVVVALGLLGFVGSASGTNPPDPEPYTPVLESDAKTSAADTTPDSDAEEGNTEFVLPEELPRLPEEEPRAEPGQMAE